MNAFERLNEESEMLNAWRAWWAEHGGEPRNASDYLRRRVEGETPLPPVEVAVGWSEKGKADMYKLQRQLYDQNVKRGDASVRDGELIKPFEEWLTDWTTKLERERGLPTAFRSDAPVVPAKTLEQAVKDRKQAQQREWRDRRDYILGEVKAALGLVFLGLVWWWIAGHPGVRLSQSAASVQPTAVSTPAAVSTPTPTLSPSIAAFPAPQWVVCVNHLDYRADAVIFAGSAVRFAFCDPIAQGVKEQIAGDFGQTPVFGPPGYVVYFPTAGTYRWHSTIHAGISGTASVF